MDCRHPRATQRRTCPSVLNDGPPLVTTPAAGWPRVVPRCGAPLLHKGPVSRIHAGYADIFFGGRTLGELPRAALHPLGPDLMMFIVLFSLGCCLDAALLLALNAPGAAVVLKNLCQLQFDRTTTNVAGLSLFFNASFVPLAKLLLSQHFPGRFFTVFDGSRYISTGETERSLSYVKYENATKTLGFFLIVSFIFQYQALAR